MSYRMIWFCDVLCMIGKYFIMQLNVKLYKITWYSIICVALPGILLLYLHIHLTTTHLNPNRCGLFVGFWLGIFAIHKTWTSLAMVEDRMIRQEPLRTQFGVLFGWFKRNFSLKTPTVVEKFHPKSWKVRKVRKIRKVEKFRFQEVSARKVENSKNSKSWKVEKFEKFEKFEKSKSSHSRRFLLEKSKKSKNSKSQKLFDFLTFCEKFCKFSRCAITGEKST